jgi:O-antigen ligase
VAILIVGGIAGFVVRYAGFFHRGATSVSARFDYWRAAGQTVLEHPLVGTGPGTFAIPYQKIKRPESEMSRLVHNDYLEQASDSGLVGFVTYAAFILGALLLGFPRPWALPAPPGADSLSQNPPPTAPDWITCCLWLGALGWALQSLLEFGLYIPALAWPAFTFMGLLLGRRKEQ